MRFFYRVLVWLTLPVYSISFAQTDLARTLSLEQAIAATLEQNPQLTEYRFKSNLLAGEKYTASLKPGYQLSGSIENIAGPGEYQQLNAAEYTLSLSSIIELGGQREARTAFATARQEEFLATQRIATLDLIVDVTQQFIKVASIQEQVKRRQELLAIYQSRLNTVSQLRQIGKLSDAELLRAKAALSLSEIELQKTKHQFNKERLLLSRYWAKPYADFGELQTRFYQLPKPEPLEKMLARLANNADMQLTAQKIKTQKAKLKQIQSEGRSNIEWSTGIRQLNATDDTALVLGVSLPLGTNKRARGAITSASVELEQAEWQETNTRTLVESELSRLWIEQQEFIHQAKQLRDQVIPLLEQASQLTAQGFERGAFSFMELKQTQEELTNTQFMLISATEQAHVITADIERLLGLPEPNHSIE